jgi:hypothetical protein
MKFHLVRPALVLASSLVLASCGGGGKESYPVKVTVSNVRYEGLVLSTNGQTVSVPKPAKDGDPVIVTFPNSLDYGTYYNVIPQGGTAALGGGKQPAHQNCISSGVPREYGTAGQTASVESARTPAIEVFYNCTVNAYELSGTVSGATTGIITLINGSNSQVTIDLSKGTAFRFPNDVPYGNSFGVSVLTQPEGFNCTVANGTGEMLQPQETAGGVKNVAVTCVKS